MSFDLAPFIRLDVAATLRDALRRETDGPARGALEKALRALREKDLGAAQRILEYAQRLTPSATYVTLAIGEARLLGGDPRAAEAFELVARRTDWPGAWLRLALARLRQGDPAQAAAELQQILSRNAPPADAGFRRLAGEIVRLTGARGWCGLDTRGRITLGLAGLAVASEQLDIRLDDAPADVTVAFGRADCAVRHARIAGEWRHAASLAILADGRRLIGSPIDVQLVTRSEGFVRAEAGGLRGWCWLPGDRETAPAITVVGRDGDRRWVSLHAVTRDPDVDAFADLAAPRAFSVSRDTVAALGGDVDVLGPFDRPLYGSPLNPLAAAASAAAAARAIERRWPALGTAAPGEREMAEISIPVGSVGPAPDYARPAARRGVLVVIPVYRGTNETIACIDSVLAARGAGEHLLVVVDASPERELVAILQQRAARGDFALDVRPVNRGFPATANIGLRRAAARGQDVILLNSDTLVPPGWAAALQAAIHGERDIGTTTPLSNAATILSYPAVDTANPVPDLATTMYFADVARRANAGRVVELPTGHGFCLYIRHACLVDVGLLREDVFAQGYAEENDWCLRARHLGWRHVAVPGVFVGHAEARSFAGARRHLAARNLDILNRLHPGYDALIAAWQARGPLDECRRAMDLQRWHDGQRGRKAVLLVTHDRAGGVKRHVLERAAAHHASGRRVIILRPGGGAAAKQCCVEAFAEATYPNLCFAVPRERPGLLALLHGCAVEHVELHHFVGHDWATLAALKSLDVGYDVYIHDYAWYCPRITLTRRNHSYCGEPALEECSACVIDYGRNIDEDIAPAELFGRSRKFLRGARRIVVPSEDTARRIGSRFGVKVTGGVWQDDTAPLVLRPTTPAAGGKRRICVAGAIGYEKGYHIILECARIITRDQLPLEFVIVGYSCADAALLDTGSVRITGRYEEAEAVDLIRQQQADFAFLTSLWPETWSYVLSQFWAAQLAVIAFDIGAPAERIRRRSGGFLMPLNLPVPRILQTFLTFSAFAS